MGKKAKADTAKAIKRKADESLDAPDTPTKRPHDGKGRELVGSVKTRSPFINAIRKHGNLSTAEKKAVEDVWNAGMTLKDCTALWMVNWLHANRLYQEGKLSAGIFQAALNQLTNSAVKLAELAERKGETLPTELRIAIDLGRAAPAGVCGDEVPIG